MTGAVPFSADSTVSTLAARVGKLMPVSADLGSLAAVLERAGRPEADDRFSAVEFGLGLVAAAEALPRPEPIPIVAATLFDTSKMRRPTDPTGGIERPASAVSTTRTPLIDQMELPLMLLLLLLLLERLQHDRQHQWSKQPAHPVSPSPAQAPIRKLSSKLSSKLPSKLSSKLPTRP